MREDAILWEVKPDVGFLPWLRSLTVSQFQIGIVMQDGEVVDIFSSRKRNLPWNLPWKGKVRTYVASTAPFTLTFWLMDPMDPEEPDDGVVLGQPVLTSDDEVVTAQLDLTMRVVRENVEYLLQLLKPGIGVVTRRDISDTIEGELLAKVLALDIHQHTAAELRGNRELLRGIYESVNIELASTIRFYGLRLDNFYPNWGLTSEERERIRQLRHEEELREIRRRQEIERAREPEPPMPTPVDPPTPVTVQPSTRTPVDPPTPVTVQLSTRTPVSPTNTPPSLPEKYHAFFQPLVDILREEYRFTRAREGGNKSWKAFSATPSLSGDVSYRVVFAGSRQVMVNIYIERNEDAEWNKRLFDNLRERKGDIESKLGPLCWDPMEGDMACRVAIYRPGTIYDDLDEIREWVIKWLLAFDCVFGPRLEEFRSKEAT